MLPRRELRLADSCIELFRQYGLILATIAWMARSRRCPTQSDNRITELRVAGCFCLSEHYNDGLELSDD